jgi:hypothetical protein
MLSVQRHQELSAKSLYCSRLRELRIVASLFESTAASMTSRDALHVDTTEAPSFSDYKS